MVHTARKKADLKHKEYTILGSIADPLLFRSSVWEAGDMFTKYSCMKVEKLYESVMFTFPGKEALKSEKK